ncbi:MAG: oligosaccharide flippase family protein [Ruminococcus sp.]|nr:oligosaccharide flippase family protein [Ruminococcus sp.]
MENSRTKNSTRNIIYAFINQGLVTVLTFITRTVLVKQLGAEYVGVNGLFTNIISMLSLAELGIGLAIPFSLYEPLANGDKKKINALMRLYSKIYYIIGTVVLVVGACLTPFLQYLVSEMPDISSIRIIYLLFVLNSGISYFWSYKSLLITSDQKAYVLTKINNYCSIALALFQCIMLSVTHNFILYLLVNTVITLVKNLYVSHECNKRYPYIKKKYDYKLDAEEKNGIKKNVFAVSLYKVGTTLLNSTDGIIISRFLGVIINGYYSNYTMITNALNSLLSQIVSGFTASVGNATATESDSFNHTLFKRLDFFNFWIYGVCTICLWALMNPFIDVWIGTEYQLSEICVWAISMNFYTLGMLSVNSAFRNTYGLFWYGKLRPVVMAIINLALDFILVNRMGVFGVVFATLVARLITTVWYDPYIVFKYGFKRSPKNYYITYLLRFMIVSALGYFTHITVCLFSINGWLSWIVAAIIVFIVINVLFLLLGFWTDEFKWMIKKVCQLIGKH